MKITGRIWEIAEQCGLQHYYASYNGDVNGAVRLYDGNDCVAVFAVVDSSGLYETYQETLELIAGTWPYEKAERRLCLAQLTR